MYSQFWMVFLLSKFSYYYILLVLEQAVHTGLDSKNKDFMMKKEILISLFNYWYSYRFYS